MDGAYGKTGDVMEELGKSASNELGSAKETTFPDFFDSLEETNGLDGISEKICHPEKNPISRIFLTKIEMFLIKMRGNLLR